MYMQFIYMYMYPVHLSALIVAMQCISNLKEILAYMYIYMYHVQCREGHRQGGGSSKLPLLTG